MARSLGVLTLDLVAKIGGFVDGLSKAEREAKKRSEGIKKNLAAIGTAAAAVATAIAASGAVMVKQFTQNAKEIDKLAKLSNASTTEFQQLAYASNTLGVQQDKLSDILKDVNDKIGDFLQTGGGPLADFFENIAPAIGVTAEQFANLSGPQALQLYVDSLQKANLSQAELTFYMEAIASDATLLLPLLKNNGAAFNDLAAQAERYGVILDQEVIQKSLLFQQQLQTLSAITQGFKNQISAELLPTLINLNELLIDLAESSDIASVAGRAISGAIKTVTSVALLAEAALQTMLDKLGAVRAAFRAIGSLDFQAFDAAVIGGVTGQFDNFAVAIERVKNLWSEVGEEAGKTGEIIDDVGGGGGKPPLGRFGTGLKETKDEVGNFIKQLEFSVATLGMTADETDRYRLALAGASQAQLDYVASLQSRVEVGRLLGEMMDQEAAYLDDLNGLMTQYDELITGASRETLEYSKTLADLNTLLQAGKISQEEFNAAVGRAEEAANKAKGGFENFSELAMEAAKRSQGAFADFLFDPFGQGLKGMLQGFADTLQRMAAEAAAAKIFESLLGGGSGGGILGGIGSAIGGLFGGGRANGGPVWPGSVFEVGEFNRPELLRINKKQYLIPGNQGQVTPMGSGTMGGSVTQVFNVSTPNPDAFRLSERQMMRRARQGLA